MIAFPSRERRVKARRRPEGAELRELNSGVNQAGGGAAGGKMLQPRGRAQGQGGLLGRGLQLVWVENWEFAVGLRAWGWGRGEAEPLMWGPG